MKPETIIYDPVADRVRALMKKRFSRRTVLAAGLAAAVTTLVRGRAFSSVASTDEVILPRRELSLFNAHSEETLITAFWENGEYVPEALQQINYIFRDHRTGKIKEIHTELLELLYVLQNKLNLSEPFHIISGYRTPKTNALLRRIRRGVARNSLHMYGKAVDIRVPGFSSKQIRTAAMELERGGVGYYPSSHFVHVDVGDIRYWTG